MSTRKKPAKKRRLREVEVKADDIPWNAVCAVLTSQGVIDEAKGDARATEDLDYEELDSFVYALVRVGQERMRSGKLQIRVIA